MKKRTNKEMKDFLINLIKDKNFIVEGFISTYQDKRVLIKVMAIDKKIKVGR